MHIVLAQKQDALAVAKIHKTEIKGGFLSSLPTAFLAALYEAIIMDPGSFCVVAKDEEGPHGFIAGTTNVKQFYSYFMRHYFFQSVGMLFLRLFNIATLKKIMENLLYPSKSASLPDAELLTMALSKQFTGRGVAASMLVEFAQQMKGRQVGAFKVIVGQELSRTIHFYEKNGFTFLQEIILHDNKKSNVYVYHIK